MGEQLPFWCPCQYPLPSGLVQTFFTLIQVLPTLPGSPLALLPCPCVQAGTTPRPGTGWQLAGGRRCGKLTYSIPEDLAHEKLKSGKETDSSWHISWRPALGVPILHLRCSESLGNDGPTRSGQVCSDVEGPAAAGQNVGQGAL